MPIYDRKCESCGAELLDKLEPIGAPVVTCECGGAMPRVWSTKGSNVIGDEIDVTITNGLCNADGSPRRFRSRSELRRVEIQRGYTNYVEHRGEPGSDKSKHTTKWV